MARYTVTLYGREYDVTVNSEGAELLVGINGVQKRVRVMDLQGTRSLVLIDSWSHEVDVSGNGSGEEKVVFTHGLEVPVRIEDYSLAQMRKAAGISTGGGADRALKAPMPGLVVKSLVEAGETVKASQPLIVIEAMKMENILKAKGPGVVKNITVATGQSVEKGETLIEFEV